MKVGELIELLRGCAEDAEVVITSQPHYPMEHAVGGVALRATLAATPEGGESPGAAASDVILVEGRWLRYGALAAWDVARLPGSQR